MKRLISILFIIGIMTGACNDESETSFNKGLLLEGITTNQLLPAFEDFKNQGAVLQQSAESFAANPTTATLATLQEQWKKTAISWKTTEVFGFGPTDKLESSIYFLPARLNLIEKALNDTESIDENYIQRLGVAAKGLPALEQLIFQNGQRTDEVLPLFTTGNLASRRISYVVNITKRLQHHATTLYQDWQAYAPSFIAQNTGNNDEVDLLANQFLAVLEDVINTQLGEPLGKKSGTDPLPTKVEAWQSGHSKALLIANLKSAQAVYTGQTQTGFNDYLNVIQAMYGNQLLSEIIDNDLKAFATAINQVNSPLQEAVIRDQSAVENAYQTGKLALIHVKIDMFSALSITIAFTDNDGD